MIWKASLLLLCLATAAQGIINGQRYSIQRVPFIFHAEGWVPDRPIKFSGVILNNKFLLTVRGIPNQVANITITVGSANVNGFQGKKYHVGKWKEGAFFALYEITDGPILFGDGIQKATLPRSLSWKPKMEVNIAGWGSVNWYNAYSTHLHFKLGFTMFDGNVDERTDIFYLTGENSKNFPLGDGNYGDPVWVEETGEVMGLAGYDMRMGDKTVVKVAHLLPQVAWIDRTMKTWGLDDEAGPVAEDETTTVGEDVDGGGGDGGGGGGDEDGEDDAFRWITKGD